MPRTQAQSGRKVLSRGAKNRGVEGSTQTVASKVSTGASKSLYQSRPRTVAFSKTTGTKTASITAPITASIPITKCKSLTTLNKQGGRRRTGGGVSAQRPCQTGRSGPSSPPHSSRGAPLRYSTSWNLYFWRALPLKSEKLMLATAPIQEKLLQLLRV